MPQATNAAAIPVSASPAMRTDSWNSAVCCALHGAAAMLPVNSAARIVPATAMPIAEVTSLTVSVRAAPIVVRLSGRPRRTFVPATTPALVARSREIAGEVQELLASELTRDSRFHGDADLFAAFFVAGYSTVLVDAARRIIDGEADEGLADRQRTRFEALFEALRVGVASSGETV